jgi:hypothetical protein
VWSIIPSFPAFITYTVWNSHESRVAWSESNDILNNQFTKSLKVPPVSTSFNLYPVTTTKSTAVEFLRVLEAPVIEVAEFIAKAPETIDKMIETVNELLFAASKINRGLGIAMGKSTSNDNNFLVMVGWESVEVWTRYQSNTAQADHS